MADHPNQVSMSCYSYAWNNPTNLTDPDGMCPECDEQTKDPQNGQSFITSSGLEYQYDGESWIRNGGDLPNVDVYSGSEEPESKKLIETGTSFIPFVGSGKDLYHGVINRDYLLAALGLGGLIIDFWTMGSGSILKGGVKSVIRYGGKELTELAIENGAKTATRSLDELSSLRGATWQEAEDIIPKDWKRGPLKKGEGVKYINPHKKGEQVLLEKGWPSAKEPLHTGPYMKISRDGQVTRLPLAGNPTLK